MVGVRDKDSGGSLNPCVGQSLCESEQGEQEPSDAVWRWNLVLRREPPTGRSHILISPFSEKANETTRTGHRSHVGSAAWTTPAHPPVWQGSGVAVGEALLLQQRSKGGLPRQIIPLVAVHPSHLEPPAGGHSPPRAPLGVRAPSGGHWRGGQSPGSSPGVVLWGCG